MGMKIILVPFRICGTRLAVQFMELLLRWRCCGASCQVEQEIFDIPLIELGMNSPIHLGPFEVEQSSLILIQILLR